MVHGRQRGDQTDEFGVSGYVYKNVFLIFDRETESLWYPLDDHAWTALAGPRRGEKLPFEGKPAPVSLAKWREKHPDTLVLLGSRADLGVDG